jgi:deoxyribodipyrimidine photolyase-related protein
LRASVQLAQALAQQLAGRALLLGALPARRRPRRMSCRALILILGDQLDRNSAVLRDASPRQDRVLMIEARNESRRVWSHKARSALFLAAMRHHAAWLRDQGFRVDYLNLDRGEAESLKSGLCWAIGRRGPACLRMLEAGEAGVQAEIDGVCREHALPLEVLADGHFYCSRDAFEDWREGRRTLVMEHFYRHMRQRHAVLMDGDQPAGGKWNLDRQNRRPFGREGPGLIPPHPQFKPDKTTEAVLRLVERELPDNPGTLAGFRWPVTREQALEVLDGFIAQRLPAFGPFQDAMWAGEPLLYHSTLSTALNLKLLNPREVVDAAVAAYDAARAPLQSVEGFVRQVLGWREYVRGVYWSEMPDYLERNALDAQQPLPAFYWTGDTDMACLAAAIGQTLELGYAHHIQRLMVTGLFALLLGVRPREVHEWYLAVYVDAVEWVEAPNTLGMSQYADGGLLASKPYAASGRYIQRMSNYCSNCRYRPDTATGDRACPFTTLYWDFLLRHQRRFAKHPRAGMQWRMLQRLDKAERARIRRQARQLRDRLADAAG